MTEKTEELPEVRPQEKATSDSEAREVHPPVKFFGLDPNDDDSLYDFRPVPVDASLQEEVALPEEETDPKDSSAPESVDSSTSETIEETESSASQTPTVDAEKDSTPPKESESGTQTSSSKTSAGKTTATAKT